MRLAEHVARIGKLRNIYKRRDHSEDLGVISAVTYQTILPAMKEKRHVMFTEICVSVRHSMSIKYLQSD
jgi:hypothetical protein